MPRNEKRLLKTEISKKKMQHANETAPLHAQARTRRADFLLTASLRDGSKAPAGAKAKHVVLYRTNAFLLFIAAGIPAENAVRCRKSPFFGLQTE